MTAIEYERASTAYFPLSFTREHHQISLLVELTVSMFFNNDLKPVPPCFREFTPLNTGLRFLPAS
jgi:hypothetical protein